MSSPIRRDQSRSPGAANWRMTAAVVCESSQISPPYTLRMLLTIRSGAVCFKTMPEQPSFIAWTNSFLSSEAVKTMTLVFLLSCAIAWRVDKPSRLGIRRSSSSTSGSSSCTLSSTSRPSLASATISKSSSRLSSLRRPSRTMGWSSAMSIRIIGFRFSVGFTRTSLSPGIANASFINVYRLHTGAAYQGTRTNSDGGHP